MKRWRLAFLALFLFCAGSIAFALYHQLYNWLMPCLLCVYQRMAIIGIGIVALLTALFPQRRRAGVVLSCGAIASIGIAGAIVAVRQVLLQYGPPDPDALCASSLPFPINFDDPFWPQWVGTLFRPVGDCSAIDFTLFGVTMPAWVALSCVGIVVFVAGMGVLRWRELARAKA